MYVVEVIPLSRGSAIETLTYYASTSYEIGSLVEIPIRAQKKIGVVIDTKPVSTAKTAVRAATFSLKKLPQNGKVGNLPSSLIETAQQLETRYPATLGAILFSLLPPEVRTGEVVLGTQNEIPLLNTHSEISVLTAQHEDRYIEYRSKIRETFAHRGSVLFVVPTTQEVEHARELLAHGIEDRLVTFASSLSKKRLQSSYDAFFDLTNAKLIITTPIHAYLSRHDITHVIVEHARSRQYKDKVRPYLDHREVLEVHARMQNRTMTLGDILPRSEDELRRREDHYVTVGENPKRISFSSKLVPIVSNEPPSAGKPFSLISDTLRECIENAIHERKRIFLYAARRGIAPVVMCLDCGHIFRDPDSGTPYALFKTGSGDTEKRWFLSSVSGKRIHAKDTCDVCGSWRLRERGVGIQYIQSEVSHMFKGTPLFVFDHTTATTKQRAQSIIGRFYEEKGVILLGTNMTLPYLERPIDVSVVTSSDAARSIPSWKADEEFFSLLLTLREWTKETVYLQARHEPDELVQYAVQGLIEHFYTEELSLREALKYPPYGVLVLLSFMDTREGVQKIETMLTEALSAWKPKYYSAPDSIAKKTTRHCLIRIPQKDWPDAELMNTLRNLPPYIKIEVNPDRIV